MSQNPQNQQTLPLPSQGNEIALMGVIGASEETTARGFLENLAPFAAADTVDIHINSQGGSIVEGLGIIGQMQRHPATFHTFIDGTAFSMASGIAVSGDKVHMSENALLMIHEVRIPPGVDAQTVDKLKANLAMVERANATLRDLYVAKTGMSASEIEELMRAETVMDAAEAVAKGFVDEITSSSRAVAEFDLPIEASSRMLAAIDSSLTKETKPMADTPTTPAADPQKQLPLETPVAATLAELKALGGDSDFTLAQLEAEATIEQAIFALKDAKIAALEARAQAAESRATELEAAAKTQGGNKGKPADPPAPTPAPQQPEPTAIGLDDPVADLDTTGGAPPQDLDPVALVNERAEEFRKQGKAPGDAWSAAYRSVYNDFPALVEAVTK